MGYFATPPIPVVDVPADSQHQAGPGLKQKLIVLHSTVGTDSRKWLSTDPASNVSVHRLIAKSGTVYKLVPDENIAQHVGFSREGNDLNLNDLALGIELENLNNGVDPYPDIQLRMCCAQICEWWGKFGFLPVVPHSLIDTAGKTDPAGLNWTRFNQLLVEALQACLGGTSTPTPVLPGTVAARLVAKREAARRDAADLDDECKALGVP